MVTPLPMYSKLALYPTPPVSRVLHSVNAFCPKIGAHRTLEHLVISGIAAGDTGAGNERDEMKHTNTQTQQGMDAVARRARQAAWDRAAAQPAISSGRAPARWGERTWHKR
jgi:hypothetical protein